MARVPGEDRPLTPRERRRLVRFLRSLRRRGRFEPYVQEPRRDTRQDGEDTPDLPYWRNRPNSG